MPVAVNMQTAALIVYVVSVALIDARTHRIPNVLSGAALAAALTLQSATGAVGLSSALLGMAAGLLIFLPFYILHAFGAGDVKAMSVVGAFLGLESTLAAAAATLIAGSIIGIGFMIRTAPNASGVMFRLLGLMSAPLSTLRINKRDAYQRFPYGVAIAVGTTAVVMCNGHLPFIG